MEKPDMRIDALHNFAVELKHKPQIHRAPPGAVV
jgi:hypothetical protein